MSSARSSSTTCIVLCHDLYLYCSVHRKKFVWTNVVWLPCATFNLYRTSLAENHCTSRWDSLDAVDTTLNHIVEMSTVCYVDQMAQIRRKSGNGRPLVEATCLHRFLALVIWAAAFHSSRIVRRSAGPRRGYATAISSSGSNNIVYVDNTRTNSRYVASRFIVQMWQVLELLPYAI